MLVSSFPPPPDHQESTEADRAAITSYFINVRIEAADVVARLDELHRARIVNLETMRKRALDSVWWPFVQHGTLQEENISVIDSAQGDFFHVHNLRTGAAVEGDNLMSVHFDGSASWWTQAFGHANPALALAAARAAGRYGHVLFPEMIHSPVLSLIERLLALSTGKGWASRVFISDNGSTAMEIALKMALRAYSSWFARDLTNVQKQRIGILGLKGSYHGDTIGAMDACNADDGVYTCEWHSAKGYWLDPPTVGYRNGKISIALPPAMSTALGLPAYMEGESTQWIYDVTRRLHSELSQHYEEYITSCLKDILKHKDLHIGALVLEPLVMGAGGMIFVDPLFQRVLVDVARKRVPDASQTGSKKDEKNKLPVIFDEVFVGLHRLGQESCSSVLGVHPDIAVYAKMLTGGTVPLAVTLTSTPIFNAFYSDKKSDALLHGHSYTAHAVGCEVANESLNIMANLSSSSEWDCMRKKWTGEPDEISSYSHPSVWSFFEPQFVETLSSYENVEWAMSLGTVLAFKIKGQDRGMCIWPLFQQSTNSVLSGYTSNVAQTVLSQMRHPLRESDNDQFDNFGIHMRSLGDIAYFMTSLNTPSATVRVLEKRIVAALRAI